jgi:hypothetical protein
VNNIEEYKTIVSGSPKSLDAKVNEALKEDWQPFGSPFVHNGSFAQAMVKFHKTTPAEKIAEISGMRMRR